jgi:hypothetical protein
MIEILKGKRFGATDSVSFRFEFRGNFFTIDNLERKDCPPFDGCVLDLAAVYNLLGWLKKMIRENEQCDECFDFRIPLNFKGTIECTTCGVSKVNE